MDRLIPFIKAYWAALLWAAFIFLLMALPGEDLPNFDFWAINIEDKLGHIAVFGLLSLLATWGVKRHSHSVNKKALRNVLILCIAYGGITEILQGVAFPTRFASLWDFLADSLGAFLGIVFAHFVFYKLHRQKS
ncbi:MAG: VanZ family protein [Bacteroidota bacterium]